MLPGFDYQNSTDLGQLARELTDLLGTLDPHHLLAPERAALRELLDELITLDGALVRSGD